MFDQILPTLGAEMLDGIAEAVGHATDPMEVERLGFTANARYLVENPFMNRVNYEAQLFTPKVYAAYIDGIIEKYVRSLRRTIKHGPLATASDEELRFIARMIVSARESVLLQLTKQNLKDPGFFGRLNCHGRIGLRIADSMFAVTVRCRPFRAFNFRLSCYQG